MLAWVTDIHVNFLDRPARRGYARDLASTGATAILATGDLSEGDTLSTHLTDLATDSGLPVWFVLGNHDYYRGGVAEVRAAVRALCAADLRLRWLHGAGVTTVAPGVALVGVDGWGDARLGAPETTSVLLNDFRLIRDIAFLPTDARNAALRALGDESAATLEADLAAALATHDRVLVATHVPPFAEACWHEGERSNDQWLPFFSCAAVGEVLRRYAEAHPTRRIDVYCGHTHSPGLARLRDNLVVHTGGAQYGAPGIAGMIKLPD